MDVSDISTYFYNAGYRRGSDVARVILPLFDNSYDKNTVLSSILEHELLMREEPIFWPIGALLDNYGGGASSSFDKGIFDGANAVLHIGALSGLNYLPKKGA